MLIECCRFFSPRDRLKLLSLTPNVEHETRDHAHTG